MNLSWLTICAEGQTEGCIPSIQLLYLVALVVGVVLLAIIARPLARPLDGDPRPHAGRDRDQHRRRRDRRRPAPADLPRLDRHRARRRARRARGPGALTGLLANLIWSILPVPGGAGPTIAFFAPVAGGHRADGRLLGEPGRLPAARRRRRGSAASWPSRPAIAAAAIAHARRSSRRSASRSTARTPTLDQMRFVAHSDSLIVGIGVVVAWISGRTVFRLGAGDPRIARYLAVATAVVGRRSSSSPCCGCCSARPATSRRSTASSTTARPDAFLGGANLTGLALADPLGLSSASRSWRSCVGCLVWALGPARRATPGCSRSGSAA